MPPTSGRRSHELQRFMRAAGFLSALVVMFFGGYLALAFAGKDAFASQTFELVKALVFAAAGMTAGFGYAQTGP